MQGEWMTQPTLYLPRPSSILYLFSSLQMQEEYRQRLAAEERAKRQAGASGGSGGEGAALGALPWVSYLTEDGKIVDCSKPGAKASVYAIFDENKKLQYVGVSRQVGAIPTLVLTGPQEPLGGQSGPMQCHSWVSRQESTLLVPNQVCIVGFNAGAYSCAIR